MRPFVEDSSHAPPGASHNAAFCSPGGTRRLPTAPLKRPPAAAQVRAVRSHLRREEAKRIGGAHAPALPVDPPAPGRYAPGAFPLCAVRPRGRGALVALRQAQGFVDGAPGARSLRAKPAPRVRRDRCCVGEPPDPVPLGRPLQACGVRAAATGRRGHPQLQACGLHPFPRSCHGGCGAPAAPAPYAPREAEASTFAQDGRSRPGPCPDMGENGTAPRRQPARQETCHAGCEALRRWRRPMGRGTLFRLAAGAGGAAKAKKRIACWCGDDARPSGHAGPERQLF